MDKLARILLHVNLMNSNLFNTALFRLDFNIAVSANRQIELGNLIVLWVIRVKIIFPVKFAVSRDVTVRCKSDVNSIFQHLSVQYRKGARHTGADRTGMGIGRAPECSGTAAENLCPGCKLNMHLKSYDSFILLFHLFALPTLRKSASCVFISKGCI